MDLMRLRAGTIGPCFFHDDGDVRALRGTRAAPAAWASCCAQRSRGRSPAWAGARRPADRRRPATAAASAPAATAAGAAAAP